MKIKLKNDEVIDVLTYSNANTFIMHFDTVDEIEEMRLKLTKDALSKFDIIYGEEDESSETYYNYELVNVQYNECVKSDENEENVSGFNATFVLKKRTDEDVRIEAIENIVKEHDELFAEILFGGAE